MNGVERERVFFTTSLSLQSAPVLPAAPGAGLHLPRGAAQRERAVPDVPQAEGLRGAVDRLQRALHWQPLVRSLFGACEGTALSDPLIRWLCDLATNGIHFTGPGIFGTPYYTQTVPVCQPGSAIFADPKVELVFMGMGLNGNDPRYIPYPLPLHLLLIVTRMRVCVCVSFLLLLLLLLSPHTFLSWACDLPGVAILALGYNELDGNLSPCLAQILQLIFLFVAGNPTLGGELPELASSVQEADFSNTSIRGTVPASYGGRPSLVALSLENLDLHGPLPDLSSVKVLSLRGNCFDIPVGGYPGWAIDAGVEFLAPNCVPSQATTSVRCGSSLPCAVAPALACD